MTAVAAAILTPPILEVLHGQNKDPHKNGDTPEGHPLSTVKVLSMGVLVLLVDLVAEAQGEEVGFNSNISNNSSTRSIMYHNSSSTRSISKNFGSSNNSNSSNRLSSDHQDPHLQDPLNINHLKLWHQQ
jgi:hypothetical protein